MDPRRDRVEGEGDDREGQQHRQPIVAQQQAYGDGQADHNEQGRAQLRRGDTPQDRH